MSDEVNTDLLTKRLLYRQPARRWLEALPIGNGRLGGMIFGGILEDRIQLNEDSVYYGGPKDRNNPFAFKFEGHRYPKGRQKLNGKEALGYSRMRYQDPDNDYGRQRRGQQVLLSVIRSFIEKATLLFAKMNLIV